MYILSQFLQLLGSLSLVALQLLQNMLPDQHSKADRNRVLKIVPVSKLWSVQYHMSQLYRSFKVCFFFLNHLLIFLDLVYQSTCTSFLVQEATELPTKQCCLLATGTIKEVREAFVPQGPSPDAGWEDNMGLFATLFVFNNKYTNRTYSLFQFWILYFRKPKLLRSLGLVGS